MSTLTKKSVTFPAGSTRAIADGGSSVTANTIHDFANNVDFSLVVAVVVLLTSGDQVFIGKRATASTEGYELGVASGQVYLTLFDTGGGEMTVTAGAVGEYTTGGIHVAALWEGTAGNDAANATIYIDGVSVAIAVVTNTLSATISNTGVFQLSGVSGASRNMIHGVLDWACVYDSLLAPATVVALYNVGDLANPIVVQVANLLAFYPFEFGPFDKSGPGDRHLENMIANGETTAATNVELVDFSVGAALGGGSNISAADTPVSTGLGGISNRCFGPQGTTERWNVTDAMAQALKFGDGDAWSLSYWYWDDGTNASTQIIMGKRLETPSFKGWDTRRRGSNKKLGFYISRDQATTDRLFTESDNSFADSSWHHVLWTIDGTDTEAGILLHVDGVSEALTGAGGSLSASFDTTEDFKIGGFASPLRIGTRIAEVQFFSRVIPVTAAVGITSAATLYNSGAPDYPNDWFGPEAPVYYSRPGEEFNHLDMVNMADDDVVDVGFGDIGGGIPDVTAPVITLVSPSGSEITQAAELVLRVTDPGGLQRGAVFHTPAGGKTEMVYEGVGAGLRGGYLGTRVDIADGFELTVTRVGGWFPPLDFEVLAYDDSGNTTPA